MKPAICYDHHSGAEAARHSDRFYRRDGSPRFPRRLSTRQEVAPKSPRGNAKVFQLVDWGADDH
jgi:hypothetical protein